jgi:hypothetical protein
LTAARGGQLKDNAHGIAGDAGIEDFEDVVFDQSVGWDIECDGDGNRCGDRGGFSVIACINSALDDWAGNDMGVVVLTAIK